MSEVTIGSRWTAIDVTFVVTNVNDDWVFYKNEKTNQEYSCSKEAFTFRLRKTVNDDHRTHF